MAIQPEVPDIEVVTVPIVPEHGQRPRISLAEADRGRPRTRRPNGALDPGRLSLARLPRPREWPQYHGRKTLELIRQCRGDRLVGLGCSRVRLIEEHRTPLVPAGDDVGVEGYRAEERNPELLAHPLAAAAAKDIGVLPAVRAGVRAHVLDDAEDGDVQCLEHPEPAAGDLETHVLRRRYDDRSGQREALR